LASASTRSCGERKASPAVIVERSGSASPSLAGAADAGGAARTRSAAGIITRKAAPAMMSCELRQSCDVMSHAAKGDTVIGAMPMPAETSETARLRCVSNHPATVAISGAKIAPAAPPRNTPYTA